MAPRAMDGNKPSDSPWCLRNFLSYGTLSVGLLPYAAEQLRQDIDKSFAEDGWGVFVAQRVLQHLENPEDDLTLRELDFLVQQKFVFASVSLPTSNHLIIRIYLIPYDLPGVQGQLRVRKEVILLPARRRMADLLPKLSRSPQCWDGLSLPGPPLAAPGITLSGIYEDLPSPSRLVTAASVPVSRRLLNVSDELENLGLRSKLYRYQRRSVAAMVQKEMDLTDEPDPLYLPVKGMKGEEFYLQPGTMEVLIERPLVTPCRGGILCEELGTGKTVMILALVLSTLHQLSAPEPSILDTRPVLTPLALRHFPSSEFGMARTRFSRSSSKPEARTRPGVPTLVELLLHRLATNPATFMSESQTQRYVRIQENFEKLEQYNEPRIDNLPFYLDYQGEPIDNERKNKRLGPAPRGPRMFYLTSATLIIVPTNLLLQWTQECSRHCEDLIRLCVLSGNGPMPPARILASEYDVRFTAEDRTSNSKEKTYRPDWTCRPCTCSEYPNVRVPKCVCKPPEYSPLLQIRWKRLVIDEGHVSASLSTALTPFTKSLSVERRWIVTGTPTTNLLGLSLGKNVSETSTVLEDAGESLDPSSRAPSEGLDSQSSEADVSLAARIWTHDDGEDLSKLGNMIAHFVGVPQLLANPSMINTHIRDALLNRRGADRREPRPGAIEVLKQFMASVMIRHRIADVEEEVRLPPINQELVLLDLEPLAVKSYNALQAVIAINAVTSERKDQDYMFHPQNRAHLQITVQNLSQIMFWSVDQNRYYADELLRDSGASSRRSIKPSTSPDDVELLNEALHHLELAAADPLWWELQAHEDVPYIVYNLGRPIFEAWTRTAYPIDSGESVSAAVAGYMHRDRLRGLRDLVVSQPLISEDSLVDMGHNTAEEDIKQRARYEASLKRQKKKSSEASQMKAAHAAKVAAEPERARATPSVLVAQSHISRTRLGSSGSSKLNYILQEVLKYSPTEKFLIFSDSELTLAHIGEALELIDVDYLRFSTQTTARVREQFVLTFETTDKYRVFLMELKHGARGLNLISASRVIFCEPVWRADVESQAIKRCHRIGQTRPITVKTLAIRGTAEQNMAARRLALRDSEKIPKLLDETGMRAFIANPKFLTHTSDKLPVVDFPLVKLASSIVEDATMDEVCVSSEGLNSPRSIRIRVLTEDPRPSTASSSKRRRLRVSDSAQDDIQQLPIHQGVRLSVATTESLDDVLPQRRVHFV
ncbi:P-loop containing nucleoside triphosphate hydrolase protein [Mycena pura]|uniref:P-loop containing nucleoside triphosphate hydrolase protein n=1 Tax=Mycena pura TaxID=153505 RepID=A0AAD6Y4J4_9AGAR|nr:P-loop containing nucleoside triphosphate hydrolase protein [Mycena pura]